MNLVKKLSLIIALAIALGLSGCGDGIPPQKRPPAATDEHGHDHDGDDHGHDDQENGAHAEQHAAGGPHGGHIIELSHDHTYHAELTDDHSTDTVTVYMLDKDLKQAKTDQTSVTVVLTADGKTESYELSGDGSKFSASSTTMLELLEAEGATGKLRVTIDGKAMSGNFTHHEYFDADHGEHGHNDHGHDH